MPDESEELMRVARLLVFRVAVCSFGGELPPNAFCVTDAIAAILPPEMSEQKKEEAKPYIFCAVSEYLAAQSRMPL